MGILTKAKLKSLNQNSLPKEWLSYDHNDFILVGGRLQLKPLSHRRIIKPLIFIEYGRT
jgi:hypothetical protein